MKAYRALTPDEVSEWVEQQYVKGRISEEAKDAGKPFIKEQHISGLAFPLMTYEIWTSAPFYVLGEHAIELVRLKKWVNLQMLFFFC
jgi:hypothetical protein